MVNLNKSPIASSVGQSIVFPHQWSVFDRYTSKPLDYDSISIDSTSSLELAPTVASLFKCKESPSDSEISKQPIELGLMKRWDSALEVRDELEYPVFTLNGEHFSERAISDMHLALLPARLSLALADTLLYLAVYTALQLGVQLTSLLLNFTGIQVLLSIISFAKQMAAWLCKKGAALYSRYEKTARETL